MSDLSAEDVQIVREALPNTASTAPADPHAALTRLEARLAATTAEATGFRAEAEAQQTRFFEALARAEAAEASLAEVERERDEALTEARSDDEWTRRQYKRAEAAEARVVELEQANEVMAEFMRIGTERPPEEVFAFFRELHGLAAADEACDGSADCKARVHILGCFAGPAETALVDEAEGKA